MRERILMLCWFAANAAGIGILAFSDVLLLRILAWIWLSLALSLSGLVEIGGMFGAGQPAPTPSSDIHRVAASPKND